MSEPWMGLHNPERHERNGLAAWCSDEEITCSESYPCRCCLAAEVKALREQIQAVRDVCMTHHMDDSYPKRRKVVFLDRVLRALDGTDG